jgi:sulfite reductase beta subunit-like hemoprotein
VGYRTPAHLVPEAVERLLRKYLVERDAGENLRAYFARNTDADLRAALAGEEIKPVERDLPSGRVPAELAG